MPGINEGDHVDCRDIDPFGQAASVCDQSQACFTERSNEPFSFGAFLIAIDVKNREFRQELHDSARAIGTEFLGARYTTVKRNRALRSSFLWPVDDLVIHRDDAE